MCICSFYICSCLRTCRCRLKARGNEDKRGKKAELPHPRRPRCSSSPQPRRDAAAPAGLTGGTRAVLGVHDAAAGRQCRGWSFTLPEPPLFIHGGREECKTSAPPPARSLRTALPAAAPGAADSPLPSRWVTMRWVTATPGRTGGWTDTQIYTHRRACRERAAHHTAVPSPP